MRTGRLLIGSPFLVALLLTAQAIPAWGVDKVISVTATAPLTITGGMTPNISLSGMVPVDKGGTGTTDGLASVQKKLGKVAIVAQSGGNYTSPDTAMANVSTGDNWCGNPSPSNRCLVKIMPGVYDLKSGHLDMLSYVDIEGSGEEVTVITGALFIDPTAEPLGLVNGASNAEIRFLTVKSACTPDGGCYSRAIVNNSASPKITHVTAKVSGNYTHGVYNYSSSPTMSNVTVFAKGANYSSGVGNYNSSSPVMSNVTATVCAGSQAAGVYNVGSSPVMSTVTASAYGDWGDANSPCNTDVFAFTSTITPMSHGAVSYGVYNGSSSPTMSNVTATASGNYSNYGVYNSSSSPTMSNVTATASGGSVFNCGVDNDNSSSTIADRSTFNGVVSVFNTGTLNIGSSKLVGTVLNSGTITCVASYNGDYVALGTGCQ